jgi:hypothetical protein
MLRAPLAAGGFTDAPEHQINTPLIHNAAYGFPRSPLRLLKNSSASTSEPLFGLYGTIFEASEPDFSPSVDLQTTFSTS